MSNLGERLESAIGNMTGSMSEVVKVVSQSRQLKVEETKAEPIPEAPLSDAKQIRVAAMEAIENNEGLSDNEIAQACIIISKDPDIGSAYMSISRPGARTSYLQMQLEARCRERYNADE